MSILKKLNVTNWLKKFHRLQRSIEYILFSSRRWITHSSTLTDKETIKYLRLRILVATHTLEKGFSHKIYKPGFGKDVVIDLVQNLQAYITTYDYDKFAVKNAYAVLKQYHAKNAEYGFDDSKYVPSIGEEYTISTGSKEINTSQVNGQNFSNIAKSRVSVRFFDEKGGNIDNQTLLNCVSLAQTAPNACNRQAIRVHITTSSEIITEIEDIQLGCKNFGRNASALIFITSDLELYELTEFKLPGFDAGLFTMNLIYSLQEEGILSCVLNASFPGKANKRIHELLGIPENEDIEGLLAIFKPECNITIRVPNSERLDVNTICTINN